MPPAPVSRPMAFGARRKARVLLQASIAAVRAGIRFCITPLPRGQYFALSTRPVILLVKDYAAPHPRAAFLGLLRRLRRHRPHVFYCTSWHVHPGLVEHHLNALRRLERACPGVRITVMGQTMTETDLFAARGVQSLFCNQNAFADERIFRPLPAIEKRFAAIYDAQLAPYKRHTLARKVFSLAMMGYRNPGTTNARYAADTARKFATAHWFNDPTRSPDQWRMTDEDVNLAYNQCGVGLCLSAVEGAMWASIQYLLAGLPVVSTPSEGGRDEFFEAPHVRIVEPTQEAVTEGVAQLCSTGLDPEEVRGRTLARMEEHRQRFLSHVQALFEAAGEPRPFAEEWRQVIHHRLTDLTLVGRGKRRAIEEHNRRILEAVEQGEPHPGSGEATGAQGAE